MLLLASEIYADRWMDGILTFHPCKGGSSFRFWINTYFSAMFPWQWKVIDQSSCYALLSVSSRPKNWWGCLCYSCFHLHLYNPAVSTICSPSELFIFQTLKVRPHPVQLDNTQGLWLSSWSGDSFITASFLLLLVGMNRSSGSSII